MPPGVYSPELLDLLEGLGSAPFAGEIYRHMFDDYPPSRINTSGARWNPRGVAAIYTSLERETALAEAAHALAVQPFRPKVRRTVYRVRVRLNQVVALAQAGILKTVDLSREQIESDDLEACQHIGGAVRWLGSDGMLVPSARCAGTNLVIFPRDDYEFEVLGSEPIDG